MTDIFSKERSEPLLQGKQLAIYVANDKISDFKWKLELWKIIRQCELDSVPVFRLFAKRGSDTGKCNLLKILMLYNEIPSFERYT